MRTIERDLRAALLAAALLVPVACQEGGPVARKPQRSLAEALSPAASQSEPVLNPVIAETLRSLREEKLSILAPKVAPQRLDFGVGRLAQAAGERVIFRDTERGDSITEPNTGAVRAVAHGTDGSLFAIGEKQAVRLLPRMSSAKAFPAPIYLPDASLLADLADPSHFFIFLPGAQQLYQYSFEGAVSPFAVPDEVFSFAGCTGALGLLRDGAFVCGTDSGFARKAPRGARTTSAFPSAPQSFRLLAAKRLDELFAIDQQGGVQHLRWSGNLRTVGSFRLPALPYAAASNEEALAFVLVDPPGANHARRWSLLVTDFEGKPRFQSELAAKPAAASEGWLAALTEDKNLAISAFQPLVAVGGAGHVTVWSYTEGRQVFSR